MKISPLQTGLVGGFSAILLEVLFKVSPPQAYGLCVACHTRDLVNWIVNHLAGTALGMAPVSKFLPVLTVVGLLIGALAGAIIHKDFQIRKTHNLVSGLIIGFLVMNFALLMGGCPIRMALRTGYGDLVALLGVLAIGVGVIVATETYLKKQ